MVPKWLISLILLCHLQNFGNSIASKKFDRKQEIAEDAKFMSQNSLGQNKPLKIAQVANIWQPVPPKKYGGIERMVYFLTEELVRMGHDITLFASSDSITSAKLISTIPSPRQLKNDTIISSILKREYPIYFDMVAGHMKEFDLMHFHYGYWEFVDPEPLQHCSLTEMHGPANDYPNITDPNLNVAMISISNDQRTHYPHPEKFYATVYHGLPKDLLKFQKENAGDYLVFIGRIHPDKGIEMAIQIAIRTRIPLKIAAWVQVPQYWDSTIGPLVANNSELVEMLGEVNEHEKEKLLGGALAVLFPIDWAEPFGLVLIEAMATGTPVIARRRGSVPEIIEHGVTGFIHETLDEAVGYVKRVKELDRTRIRKEFEKRFTVERMAQDYVNVYRKRLQENKKKGIKCGRN